MLTTSRSSPTPQHVFFILELCYRGCAPKIKLTRSRANQSSVVDNQYPYDTMCSPRTAEQHWNGREPQRFSFVLVGEDVTDDPNRYAKHRPRLHVERVQELSELGFWKLFFPMDDIPHILHCTNRQKPEKNKDVTQIALLTVFGILYAMTTTTMPNCQSYWSTEDDGLYLYPAPAFGQRFNIGSGSAFGQRGETLSGGPMCLRYERLLG